MPAAAAPAQPAELSIEAAAVKAGVSGATISRWIRENKIASRRSPVGNRRLVNADSLATYLATGEPAPAASD